MSSPCCKVIRFSAVLLFTLSLLLVAEPSLAQPAINSHTPGQNALDVSADTNIVVQFSEAINGATVNENTFNVDGAMTGEIAGVFTGGGTDTITFDPTTDFKPGEIVTVTLTTGIENTSGAALTDPHTWQFTVASRKAAGTFGPQQIISTSANGACSVYAADLDGDGDMDVLSAEAAVNKIAWYENGSAPTNWAKTVIPTSADRANSVVAADLDGDGDLDVLSAFGDHPIAWYENGSTPNWNETQISTITYGACSVYAADLDGDGDLDVLSVWHNDDKIAWYENGSALTNWAETTISNSADYAKSVVAADLDGDGDLDVLSASWPDNKIAWYENKSPTLAPVTILLLDDEEPASRRR